MKTGLKRTFVIALLAVSSQLATAQEVGKNLIVNPNLETQGETIPGWVKMLGSLESDRNADGESCGRMNLSSTVTIGDKTFAKSSIIQTVDAVTPGNYMLSFSLSGENLKAIYVVFRFQEHAGIGTSPVLGALKRYIDVQELPGTGDWKRYISPVTVPAGATIGYLTVESLAEPDQEGARSFLNDVKFVKQED